MSPSFAYLAISVLEQELAKFKTMKQTDDINVIMVYLVNRIAELKQLIK